MVMNIGEVHFVFLYEVDPERALKLEPNLTLKDSFGLGPQS